ncbi:MAG TPA: hypothetical protein VFO10_12775 [Oligoflexus sp.]|uniref:hypothetical protein n=1 Tax=Oligoflexus sp. TaxID=1971216 RepID=UPI002D7E640C|nr:hypothetical protein [Oligoflexus sp.]HET9238125.1 hypothetical protein [Oligoflexus sp.]
MLFRSSWPAIFTGLLAFSCTSVPKDSRKAETSSYTGLDRKEFNRLAVRLNLPLLWDNDANNNGAVDPAEVRTLRFYPTQPAWTDGGSFTPAFVKAFADIKALAARGPASDERLRLIEEDLDKGLPTVIDNDLTKLNASEKAFAASMLKLAEKIDALYARQAGLDAVRGLVPKDEASSQSLFRRNWGPRCRSPQLENEPKCTAIPGMTEVPVDIYPAALQKSADFCLNLEKDPKNVDLMSPFTVVREEKGQLTAVPYTKAYQDLMSDIAKDLEAAAGLLDENEAALKKYVLAAAGSFRSNDWVPADEAWSRMSATNSRFYLRVGPDETYWEPCSRKAGFHMTFALINKDSLKWQETLTPGLQSMEEDIAKLIGAPYKARKVSFHLPDFIDIIVNAGDDRDAFGLTVGQSLPNWGPVANEGRGRTVAMSNVYLDTDSKLMLRQRAESLFAKEDLVNLTDDKQVSIINTILHEINHNLGPSHEYAYRGKRDGELFGGQLASMLEELKAQTSGLYFIDALHQKGFINDQTARGLYMDSVLWAFGHISQGMWTARKERKAYSQLAAIQLGLLLKEKAVTFNPDGVAANGKDKGTFHIDFAKMHPTLVKMARDIGRVKAKGDKKKAEEWTRDYVDGNAKLRDLITERYLRYPKQSFVYAVEI